MTAMVLLRHDLPDGSWHFDWLIDRGEGGPLLSFRVVPRIDDPQVLTFDAERILDHRRDYLDYEGEVSGGRGMVRREAVGVGVACSEEGPNRVHVSGDWGFGAWEVHGWCVHDSHWRFDRHNPGESPRKVC